MMVKATILVLWMVAQSTAFADAPTGNFDHTYKAWDGWLKQHVTVKGPISTVNYKAAKKNLGKLPTIWKTFTAVSQANYKAFAPKQRLAFLINAYNAFTVKLILDHYPVDSIKDTGSFFKSPWKKRFFKLLGEEHHLDDIEHGMIRKQFKEPRIHMAVVCASIGCPAIRDEAWVETKLETQLEEAAENFLADNTRNSYNANKNEFELSKIFDWYGSDFEKSDGSVQAFVSKRMGKTDAIRKKMLKAELDFKDYDWKLNETK